MVYVGMAGRAKIIAFRHGESEFNRDGRFAGHQDPFLTQKGIQQCEGISQMMAGMGITPTRGYHSGLIRSTQSLMIVLRPWGWNFMIGDPRIRERSFGELEGLSFNAGGNYRGYTEAPPGGESVRDIEPRVQHFLSELTCSLRHGEVALISTHDGPLRVIMRSLDEGMTIEQMCSIKNIQGKVHMYDIELRL